MFILKTILVILIVPILYKAITLIEYSDKAIDFFLLAVVMMGLLYLIRIILKNSLISRYVSILIKNLNALKSNLMRRFLAEFQGFLDLQMNLIYAIIIYI